MTTAIALVLLVTYLHLMSTALIIVLSILTAALFVAEGIICGKICSELVHRKDKELNEVCWFWFGFFFTWVAILLTLVVKKENSND